MAGTGFSAIDYSLSVGMLFETVLPFSVKGRR